MTFDELQQSTNETVVYAPDTRGTSATLSVFSPDSTTAKATVTATLADVDAEVTALGATPDVLTLDNVDGLTVWGEAWYVSVDGWTAKVRVAAITALVVTLASAPPGAPKVGDQVLGLEFSAEILAAVLATRGTHWRLVWSVTEPSGYVRRYTRMAAVVLQRFRAPTTPDDAARVAQETHAGWAKVQGYGVWRALAEQCSDDVRTLLREFDQWPHLQGNHDAFQAAGDLAVKLRLLDRGVGAKDAIDATYRAGLEKKLEVAVRQAVAGSWNDENDDQLLQASEVRQLSTIDIVRV